MAKYTVEWQDLEIEIEGVVPGYDDNDRPYIEDIEIGAIFLAGIGLVGDELDKAMEDIESDFESILELVDEKEREYAEDARTEIARSRREEYARN